MTTKYYVAPKPDVKILPSGREVCSQSSKGKAEYASRTLRMAERQAFLCALCGHLMRRDCLSFDHEAGRGIGGSRRDDRIEVDGKWQNAAVHIHCNGEKGSRRFRWQDGSYTPVEASKGGRHSDLRRDAYLLRFQLDYFSPSREIPDEMLDQLDRCKSDEARRIILGVPAPDG